MKLFKLPVDYLQPSAFKDKAAGESTAANKTCIEASKERWPESIWLSHVSPALAAFHYKNGCIIVSIREKREMIHIRNSSHQSVKQFH